MVKRLVPESYPEPRSLVGSTLEEFARRWPKAFGSPRPLKRGIYQNIRVGLMLVNWRATEKLGINEKIISLALGDWTRSPAYLAQLKEGAVRVDLWGRNFGVVTAAEAAFATYLLKYYALARSKEKTPAG